MQFSLQTIKVFRICAVIASTGIIVFAFAYWLYRVHSPCQGQRYTHINESLQCDSAYVLDKSALIRLQRELEIYIQEQTESGNIQIASVYVRDLYNGPTLNVNGNEKFSPASLLKLPLMLTYLSLREELGESLFRTELVYTLPEEEPDQLIPPESIVLEGVPYTVEDLLERMIIYSDNRAYLALREYLAQLYPHEDKLMQTYVDLGVIDPEDYTDQTLTTKTYASLFTQLFHASYLRERASSEWALDTLSRSTFDEGMVAGVPEGTEVAHKFGERFGFEDDNLKQLHDCGIVYFPDNPYLICVMTRGEDIDRLKEVIARISEIVYQEFEARKY